MGQYWGSLSSTPPRMRHPPPEPLADQWRRVEPLLPKWVGPKASMLAATFSEGFGGGRSALARSETDRDKRLSFFTPVFGSFCFVLYYFLQ